MASYLPTPKSKQPKPEKPREQPKPVEPAPQPVKPAPQPVEPSPAPKAVKPARRGGLPDWAKGMLTTLGVAVPVIIGIFAFLLVRNFVASNGVIIGVFNPVAGDNTPLPPGVTPTAAALPPAIVPWNGKDRVTVLVMGLDYRDWGPEGNSTASRTDSMHLLSLDPIAKTAVILSIPRDLYVDIPGYGFDKINKAYFYAEKEKLPIGGPGLAMRTVEGLIGVPIDYYAVVDFNSFTTLVDTIDGIDVYVPFDNFRIDPVGEEDVKELFFGWNHLTGSEALAYARARSTEGGDFDRAARTQQVILAIRDKILNLNMIPTLLVKAPDLYTQISAGLKTNLTLEQMLQLAMVAKDVKRQNIKQGVISEDYLLAMETFNEESMLIPNLDKIAELRATLFTTGGILGYANPPTDWKALAFQENAKIEIVNGSGVDGAAGAAKNFLVSQGFSEANIAVRSATSDELFAHPLNTLITDYTGRPFTVRLLTEIMKFGPANLKTSINMDSPVDVQIFLKFDWSPPR
jgi:LCP family protein required for cell wall assembly